MYVSTPLVMRSGKPYDFYIEQRGEQIVLSDDGITLFEMRGMGYPLDDLRQWKGLRSLADAHGCSLNADGTFSAEGHLSSLADLTARVLKLFCAISQWEEEKNETADVDLSLTLEVESIMAEKDPLRRLVHDPSFQVKETDVRFDYLWGNIYVDVLTTSQRSVNPRLRKAIIVGDQAPMLFVVDDRQSIIKADREVAVIGAVAQAIRLQNFRDYYVPPQIAA